MPDGATVGKKILVASHERSGTHFLINSIALNFGHASRQIDLALSEGFDPRQPRQSDAWLARYRGQFVSNIFKSHHSLPLLMPVIEPFLSEYHVFYIYRDGRDVMTSFWRYLNRLKAGWGPQAPTPGDFMRAVPTGGILQYQSGPCESMLARWVRHVSGWLDAGIGVHPVSYESLHQNFDTALQQIGGVLGRPGAVFRRPGMDAPSSLPWRGEIGNWRACWQPEDESYFAEHAGALMARLGYEKNGL